MGLEWIVLALSLVTSFLLYKAPKSPDPTTLDELEVPQAEQGKELGLIGGSPWIQDPQIAWYGHLRVKAIKSGGDLFGNTTQIGEKIYLGMHAVFCLGPVDRMVELRFDGKLALGGSFTGGRAFINKSGLFGGKKREGGVSGFIDIEMGHADQGQNDYLVERLGEMVPAHRGVFGIVFRQTYFGNSRYLKPFAAKLQRVDTAPDGGPQWYPNKSSFSTGISVEDAAIYFALDGSGSMSGVPMLSQKFAVKDVLVQIRDTAIERNDIRIVLWSDAEDLVIERRNCKTSDYDELIDWVENLPTFLPSGDTDFLVAVQSAKLFFDGFDIGDWWNSGSRGFPETGDFLGKFSADGSKDKRRVMVFLTDGVPTVLDTATQAALLLENINSLEVYGFNVGLIDTQYTEMLDNTPGDGVPIISNSDQQALAAAITKAFSNGKTYNAVHLIRDALLFPTASSATSAGDLDDSWQAAADTCFTEGFGVSLRFQNPSARAKNIQELERHIDGRVFKNRATGKWSIKLIRPDYDTEEIPVFDQNVIEWTGFTRKDPRNLTNQITLVYRHPKRPEKVSITVTDEARVQIAERVINDKVEYPGITDHDLASRVAWRDLSARSHPGWSGRLKTFPLPTSINKGDAIVLNNPRIGIKDVVFRIADIKEGDGRNNEVEIEVVEEVFALPAQALTAPPPDVEPPALSRPEPAENRLVEEAPYFELVRAFGKREADNRLADAPALGYLNLAAAAPTDDATEATIVTDIGAGFTERGELAFSEGAPLRSTLSARADHTAILVDMDADLQQITIGSLALIGTEYVRIDAIEAFTDMFQLDDYFAPDDLFGNYALIRLGRACLDTAPARHASGDRILFWSELATSDGAEYLSGDSVDVKLLTVTGRGELEQADAPTDNVAFNQRAVRPYAPGNFRIEGGFAPVVFVDTIDLTWSHRDRLQQATGAYEGHTHGDIGPEAGVTYRLRVEALDAALSELGQLLETDLGTATSYQFDLSDYANDFFARPDYFAPAEFFGDNLASEARAFRFAITSIRDGLEAWQAPGLLAYPFQAPTILSIEES